MEVMQKGAMEVARVLGDVGHDLAAGQYPVELLKRFREGPWRVLNDGEVWATQFGGLIPKDVDLSTVRVLRDIPNGHYSVVGVRNDGRYWHDGAVKDIRVSESDPFLPNTGGRDRFVDADGNVRALSGIVEATKMFSRDPFIAFRMGRVGATMLFGRGNRAQCPHLAHSTDMLPVSAVITNDVLNVWMENGGIYRHRGNGANWSLIGSFSVKANQTLHAVASEGDTTVVVFQSGEASDAKYSLVALRNGEIVTQIHEGFSVISQPIVTSNGAVFIRIHHTLMWLPPKRRVFEMIRNVTGDPVGVRSLGNILDGVRALCAEGTMFVDSSGNVRIEKHPTPTAVYGEHLVFQLAQTRVLEIAKYQDEGVKSLFTYDRATMEEFLVLEDGFRCSVLVRDSRHGEDRRKLIDAQRDPDSGVYVFRSLTTSTDYAFDLSQVVRGRLFREIFVVAKNSSCGTKSWCILENNGDRLAHEVGKPSHLIDGLRQDGDTLRWFRRDGRRTDDCRALIK